MQATASDSIPLRSDAAGTPERAAHGDQPVDRRLPGRPEAAATPPDEGIVRQGRTAPRLSRRFLG